LCVVPLGEISTLLQEFERLPIRRYPAPAAVANRNWVAGPCATAIRTPPATTPLAPCHSPETDKEVLDEVAGDAERWRGGRHAIQKDFKKGSIMQPAKISERRGIDQMSLLWASPGD
jgi:hypothetical protein